MSELTNELFTFGKYKNKTLDEVLKDRNYCKWLLDPEQDWFQNYEYLYNKVLNYIPFHYFINIEKPSTGDFVDTYELFNLKQPNELEIELSEKDKICYCYYLKTINDIKEKIKNNSNKNKYDIKCPTKWLIQFEKETNLSRTDFKTFLSSYELKNITSIIEDIKKQGNIIYKGAVSYKISKKKSEIQEKYWEKILKEKYEEQISVQFKYEKCIFDFINISKNTIYECKLGLKDFNEIQYNKYLITLDKYDIIYLIDTDCVIVIKDNIIYTSNIGKYVFYICNIPLKNKPSKFDIMIFDFKLVEVENVNDYI
jgi:hypothetical protein